MKLLVFCLLFLLSCLLCCGQLNIPEASPPGYVIQKVGFTTIRIYYERPAARGRAEKEIFGKLVPWGEVWRTGAGNCTKIAFSTNVIINGKTIPAGTYSLFTIPTKKNWTVILNTDTISYGTYSYDEKKDVVRSIVKPQQSSRYYESLTIDIDVIPNDARIYLSWLNTQIAFDIDTGLDEEIMSYINQNLILHNSNEPELYESAIMYYLWHNKDRKQLMTFIERGITLKNHRRWYYWKVTELMKDKKYDEAIEASNAAIDVIRKSLEERGYDKDVLIKDFENLIAEIKAKKRK